MDRCSLVLGRRFSQSARVGVEVGNRTAFIEYNGNFSILRTDLLDIIVLLANRKLWLIRVEENSICRKRRF
jgi:hypothetical protein